MANKTNGKKAGKRARGKSTMKDLELPTRKAKGVKGGAKAGSINVIKGAYTPF